MSFVFFISTHNNSHKEKKSELMLWAVGRRLRNFVDQIIYFIKSNIIESVSEKVPVESVPEKKL
jgi:hypothetical protein